MSDTFSVLFQAVLVTLTLDVDSVRWMRECGSLFLWFWGNFGKLAGFQNSHEANETSLSLVNGLVLMEPLRTKWQDSCTAEYSHIPQKWCDNSFLFTALRWQWQDFCDYPQQKRAQNAFADTAHHIVTRWLQRSFYTILSGRSKPVSYTHLDVYKRQVYI